MTGEHVGGSKVENPSLAEVESNCGVVLSVARIEV
jgi:hypothetical protein